MSSPKNLLINKEKPAKMKNKSQYELYEDDLNNYKSKSRSNLQEWNMLSSRIASPQLPVKNKVQPMQVKPKPISRLGRPEQKTAQLSRISETTGKTETAHPYSTKVKAQFEEVEGKTNEELQKDLKSMRDMLQQLNALVTQKLNKYELAQFVPKGMAAVNEPQREEEIIKAKIEVNAKILQSLEKQIKDIEQMDRELQQKDYLIQLEQSVAQIFDNIKSKKRQKHSHVVAVEKLDSRLVQMRQAEQDDQYKMVKVLKHNILYYYKKYNQNKKTIEELDTGYRNLVEKDEQIGRKYTHLAKIAEEKNMLVKANRSYLENKKIHDEMVKKAEQGKKKIDVVKRSKQVECEKLEKQIESLKKETKQVEARIEQLGGLAKEFAGITADVIQKNKINNKLINKISYKFAQALLKDSTGNTGFSGNEVIASEEDMFRKAVSRPKIKTDRATNDPPTISSARYQTLNIQNTPIVRDQKLNDKNLETIEFEGNKSREFRIKPTLNIKRKAENRSRLGDSQEVKEMEKSGVGEAVDFNYKPKRFQKILSQRRDKDSN